jgi:Coenzyme PQQ synthesis protein D (PqqD)
MTRPSIGAQGRLQVSESVQCRQFDDELLLLDLGSGQYFSLNAVGARMWSALVAGKTPAEVAADMEPEYDVAAQVLLTDCMALADDLIERGLLRPRSP